MRYAIYTLKIRESILYQSLIYDKIIDNKYNKYIVTVNNS